MKYEITEAIFAGQNPKSIFEVGCAGGRLFQDYYDQRTRLNSSKDTEYDRSRLVVGGMDITNDIEEARKTYPEYAQNFIYWDVNNVPWPIPDKSYDLVFTVGTLLLIPHCIPVIKEMMRIGKKVILAEFHSDDLEKTRMETVDTLGNIYSYRFYRNYQKILGDLGIKPDITQVADKWIIKL